MTDAETEVLASAVAEAIAEVTVGPR